MSKNRKLLILCILCLSVLISEAQVRVYNTTKLNGEAPTIDGLISEDIWNIVEWSGDFTQKEPFENQKPSQQTAFKIIYDDNNLYVAIRAFDTEPEKIERRLSRRGNDDGDWVAIAFSSYNDKRTGFSFGVNAAGVKADGIVTNDVDWDDTWQPVYEVKTTIDGNGWIAEMKIPLNQLRFSSTAKKVWGLEVMRTLFRKQEFSVWQMVPQEASGWVSLWGELHGIENIKPKKEIALTPYIMGGLEKSVKEEGNPFETGTKWINNAGLDGKIAVTNNLTLNFTINPDFGQVEADPSEVNLSAFESYFREQRPFFTEGSNIYNFPLVAGSISSSEKLFYSRRIGRRPQYSPELNDNEYIKSPDYTRILGAFKLSGKTESGWSIGIMESLTNNEFADIDSSGIKRKQLVEPMTNYFNTRLQKDFNDGKTMVGGMITATNRFINDTSLNFLPKSAYSGGLDLNHYWSDRAYNLQANVSGSFIQGDSLSILERQLAPQRYFQRPDANYRNVDSNLRQLSGLGSSVKFAKIGRGHWRYGLRTALISPGMSVGDQGFMHRADYIEESSWLNYILWEPFSVFRNMNLNISQWSGWDFNGRYIYSSAEFSANCQLQNYWYINVNYNYQFFDVDRHQLRGGPALYAPSVFRMTYSFSTDARKKFVFNAFYYHAYGKDKWREAEDFGFEITYRPLPGLELSIDPVYVFDREGYIYIDTKTFENDNVYVVSNLKRKTLQFNFRINYSITPDLSIQYWGQPFFFSGDYHSFKKVTDAGNKDFQSQFHIYTDNEISYDSEDNIYNVDETKDGITDYSFENPDFSFYEFRSNFVVRWEYVPGSTAYLVWSQGRNGDTENGSFYISDRIRNLADAKANNVFLIKLSYRLSL